MSAVFFSPHSDDAVLFGTFLILGSEASVVNVLTSGRQAAQGVPHHEREMEDVAAYHVLGVTLFEQWPEMDVNPDWEAVRAMMEELDEHRQPERVFAPAVEEGGQDQHNAVGMIADAVFGARVKHYLTYTNGRSRSRGGVEVPFEPEWIALKLRALACYRSQHRLWSTQHHFLDAGLREYVIQ